MKTKQVLVSGYALIAMMAGAGLVQAAPVFQAGAAHDLKFENFENLYRTTANCAAGGCLAFDAANDPVGYQRADPTLPDNILVGDIFAGVFSVQNIQANSVDIWAQNIFSDQFGGYFVQEVAQLIAPAADPGGLDHIVLNTASVDPFNILNVAAGEMFGAWVDDGAGFTQFESNGTTFQDIAVATDGTLWATLGTGVLVSGINLDPDGYAYTHTNLGFNLSDNEAFLAFNILTQGAAYNAGILEQINDINENEIGGVSLSEICSAAEIGVIACTDIVGQAEIQINDNFTNGSSPWTFASNDPFRLITVPEPGVVGLLGMALVAFGIRRSRSRRRSA